MAKEFLYPNAAGDTTELVPYGVANNWDCVNEASSDGDSTVVLVNSIGFLEDLYNLTNHIGIGVINYIKVYANARYFSTSAGQYAKTKIKTNGEEFDGDQQWLSNTFSIYSTQYNINPATDLAWTWDDIDNLQAGVVLHTLNAGYHARCTQVYVEIGYTAPQTISDAGGIASEEAFGTPTVTGPNQPQTISPDGIASLEAFGTAIITSPGVPQTISPSGIASLEAFGTAVLTGSPYVYLTLSSFYSCYKDWTGEGGALPSHIIVYKNDVTNTSVWEQGIDEHSLRCLIGDFDPTADYTVTYQRADYLIAWDAITTYGILTHSWTDKNIGIAGTLLVLGRLELTNTKTPPITYKIQAADLSIYDGFSFDALKLGSIVTVIDEELGIDVSVRVTRLIRPDLLAPQKIYLELSNKTKSLADSISDIYRQLV